jgi:ribosome recycling factor
MSTIAEFIKGGREQMHKAVENTKRELSTIRSGKASASLLDLVRVEAYGSHVPLNQVAMIAVPEPRLITVQPFDKGLAGAIEKAIRDSDLGVNPSNDGKVLRAVFPELTEERRKDYIKMAKGKAEDGRIAIRNIRRTAKQAMDKMEKDGEVGKDDVTGAEKRLDGITKKHTDEIDEMLKVKEAELLEV